ncbi:MAG: UTP--glucose-1-phosphate uridylyltransferase GalU [Nitrospirae bacterium]|uniref:UTP--glucose-1-phosphate uridylyltransferase GalU n=1 Tax=Candidatus Magnetobacterium casense TaxID=1455061 RepID=UPI0009DD6119|nr:UTP--glucose-1-phosphate uridylyltransferase GalU [Candidatus Magnetobacterium casensis]MBF0337755.1 UTP--glucose-1-phosphate uridylyltransferase GalU [Nitrospirota bacterium]
MTWRFYGKKILERTKKQFTTYEVICYTVSVIKKAILPAAGLGTRFLPVTKASPKEMLPIVDKPLIQYSVEECERYGIDEFIIITGKNKRAIEDHFDYSFELDELLRQKGLHSLLDEINQHSNLSFAFIRQSKPLGLGHAILCSKPYVNDEAFAVLLGDDIIDPDDTLLCDMIKLYAKYRSPVIALQQVPDSDVSKYGIIAGEDIGDNVIRINRLVEKPRIEEAPSNYAVIGRYILTNDIFGVLETIQPGSGGEYQLTDALSLLLAKRPIYGYLFKGRRYDAGDKFGFLQATISLSLKRPEFADMLKDYLTELTKTF